MTGSLRELLERGAASSPDTVIVSGADEQLTWRDLHAEARSIAAALVRDGVKAQDRVVFVGKNDPSYFGYLFGCALAGAVPVPLNWRLSAAELTAMIGDSGAGVVFADEAAAPAVQQAEAELPTVRTVVALHDDARWPSLASWKDATADDPAGVEGPGAKSRMTTCRAPRAIPARAQASPPMWNNGMHTRLTSLGVKPQATEMSSSSTRRLLPSVNIAPLAGPVVPLV